MEGPGLFYCVLLALQFGLQPLLSTTFIHPTVDKFTVVLCTELCKIAIAAITFSFLPKERLREVFSKWSLLNSISVAGLPATLYVLQNILVLHGYDLLDSVTFNVLNQTKTLSAAFWLYIMLGIQQSRVQILALLLLLLAAVVLNLESTSTETSAQNTSNRWLGVGYVLGASLLSGFSSALTQKALTSPTTSRDSVLFSAELAFYGILLLLAQQGGVAKVGGEGWSAYTFIPVVTNACGGVIVGLVTKYAGGIIKGFALICGLLLTGILQCIATSTMLSYQEMLAVLLVAAAIYLHSSYPPSSSAQKKQ